MNPLPIASRHSKRLAPYRPPVRAWYGAVMATGLVVYAAVIFLSTQVNTPLGILGDMGVSVLALAGLTLLAGGLGAGLLALVARVPPLWGGAVTGLAGALAVYLWLTRGSVPEAVLGFLLVLPPAVLGGALGLGLERGFRRAGVALLLLAALGLNGAELYWLAGSGAPAHTVAQPAGVTPAALRAPDPREPGGFEVKTLTYGSGTDRREAYGSGVALRTEPVDASPFLGEWSGRQGALRTWHWGFDATQVPINGRVWYPSGEGPFPLVLFVHGNHDMTAQSEAGYGYLAELLASRGYIVASVDENYLNGGWAGDMGGRENAARAWVLLQHLEAFQRFHTTAGSPFFRRVDLAHIGLVGHSRGGEAAYLAAVFNNLPNWPDDATVPFQFQFAIRAVAAIAPVDGQYRPGGQAASLENVSYLVLQGAGD
ncbi:MAG TPA: hypothetical protein VD902_09460, partial [Symbiobacteriaceae bacterium]|nr:hypothetical protein [Symbiobacteriaceae bacterium]